MGRTRAGRWLCGECGGEGAEGGSSQLQDTAVLRQDSGGRRLADAAAVQSAGRWQFTKLIGNFRRLTGPTGKELAGWQRQRHSQDEAAITSTSLYTPARDEGTRGQAVRTQRSPRQADLVAMQSNATPTSHPLEIPMPILGSSAGKGVTRVHILPPPTSHHHGPPARSRQPRLSPSPRSPIPHPGKHTAHDDTLAFHGRAETGDANPQCFCQDTYTTTASTRLP